MNNKIYSDNEQLPTSFNSSSVTCIYLLLLGIFYLLYKKSKMKGIPELRLDPTINWTPRDMVDLIEGTETLLRTTAKNDGHYSTIENKRCLNFSSFDFMGMSTNATLEERAIACVDKYGVGSCGPRGFYGTIDVHLKLEQTIMAFLRTESAIVYSYLFTTAASVIPAYCKKHDVLIADKFVNFAVQKGMDCAKLDNKPIFFEHNNMRELEECLKKARQLIGSNKAAKIFLIVEGLYQYTGEIAPLKECVRLCREYHARIIVDECLSIGVLGKTGRGLTEFYDIDVSEIDLIIGSLEGTFGSVGGFCAGSHYLIEHQRLNGLGYCFSASVPPLLAETACTAIQLVANNVQMIEHLRVNSEYLHMELKKLRFLENISFAQSPVKHLKLKMNVSVVERRWFFDAIVDYCFNLNVLVVTPKLLADEKFQHDTTLRVTTTSEMTFDEIQNAVRTLHAAEQHAINLIN